MFEEMIEHVDDCRRPARRYSLPGSPGVDPLNQLWLNSDVDIGGLPFHAAQAGRFRDACLIIPAKFLIFMAEIGADRGHCTQTANVRASE